MGKRRQINRAGGQLKRPKVSGGVDTIDEGNINQDHPNTDNSIFHVLKKDKVEKKVDLIVNDSKNNLYRSLTICGSGLGIEKTIAVVEELKRNYLKEGTRYSQKTAIKTGDNNESHLQVILTLI